VGVFPAQNADVDLLPADFTLLAGDGKVAARPVDADAIAASLSRKHQSPVAKATDVYNSTGVIISREPGIDPATGRPTTRTRVGTEEGVGIGAPPVNCRFNNCDTSPPYPASYPSGPNSNAMEQELWGKSLPDGRTSVAVAGYLYFPKPSGKDGPMELRYDGAGSRLKLLLSNPAKR
jgi:hypothetical protein